MSILNRSGLVAALVFAASPAFADEALTNLKHCQDLAKIKAVKDADVSEHKAETDLQAAFDALNTFDETCAANSKQYQSQSTDVSQQIGIQGQDAKVKAITAKASCQASIDQLNKSYPAVNMLGGRDCAQEMRDDIGLLTDYYRQMETRSQSVATCITGPQPGGAGVR